jgi:GNAT superfamily N-acetyltransferase
MHPILDDLSPSALAFAIEANRVENFLHASIWDRATVFDEPEMVMVVTDIPIPLLNIVSRVRLTQNNLDTNIEKALSRFKEKGVPGNWHVGPATTPADIETALLSHGFKMPEIEPGMAIDLSTLKDSPLPDGLVIESINSTEHLDGYVEVGLRGFGIPDFLKNTFLDIMQGTELNLDSSVQSYLGFLNGKPVGISSVCYGAGVAGIYRVATIPDSRGKGIGTALTLRPLMDARKKGYRIGILQSSEIGYSVYEKIGFREYCKLKVYTWSPE